MREAIAQGVAKRNPGYMYVQRKRRNYCFLLVAVSFHPAHPGIQIEVVLNFDGGFIGSFVSM